MTRAEYLANEIAMTELRLSVLILSQNDREELEEWLKDMEREIAELTKEDAQ